MGSDPQGLTLRLLRQGLRGLGRAPDLLEALRAAARSLVVVIAAGILLVIVLVVVLGRPERRRRQYLRRDLLALEAARGLERLLGLLGDLPLCIVVRENRRVIGAALVAE